MRLALPHFIGMRLLSYLGATVLAAVFLHFLFVPQFWQGKSSLFEQVDASQHIAGWLFYVRDNWHFPLLHTSQINHPEGVNIAFMDSIPLAALFFKLIRDVLPSDFHYFALWHGFVFVLQAWGAVFLMRALGQKRLLASLLAVSFALTWPTLFWRLGHTALMTHGLLLFALGVYFLGKNEEWSSRKTAWTLFTLAVLGTLIHPYFLAFIFPFFVLHLFEQGLEKRNWLAQLARVCIAFFILIVLAYGLGYLGKNTTSFGFGEYSMNLSAPFCGGRFYSCTDAQKPHQFDAYHFADATTGQYEGYNYLGLGLLLLIPFALILNRKDVLGLIKRYRYFLIVLLLFFIYALSNHVYFFNKLILAYPLPSFAEKITGSFRASGRFFWIVAYVILFASLVGILRQRRTWTWGLLLLALVLQYIDGSPIRNRFIDITAQAPTQNQAAWLPLLQTSQGRQTIQSIQIYPALACAGTDVKMVGLLQNLAAHYGTTVDTGYIARANTDCVANRAKFDMTAQVGQLYAMSRRYALDAPAVFVSLSQQNKCIQSEQMIFCQSLGFDELQRSRLKAQDWVYSPMLIWLGSDLPTQAGLVQGTQLHSQQREGFISYGPYLGLRKGMYRYEIEYQSMQPLQQIIGYWDVMLNLAGAPKQLARGDLVGSHSEQKLYKASSFWKAMRWRRLWKFVIMYKQMPI